jgi:hypothetical protein
MVDVSSMMMVAAGNIGIDVQNDILLDIWIDTSSIMLEVFMSTY